jgi:hypothetical protein
MKLKLKQLWDCIVYTVVMLFVTTLLLLSNKSTRLRRWLSERK